MSERIYFGTKGKGQHATRPSQDPDIKILGDLIQIQLQSYFEFLQKDVTAAERTNTGLQAVFKEVFPITSYDESFELDFVEYSIDQPKISDLEALRNGETYSASMYVKFALRSSEGSKVQNVYMGDIPMMTERGTFVINGAERVIISQLHRSPGIAFEVSRHINGKNIESFRIIPDRGSWLEVQFDTNDLLYVYLDRRRRRRKFLATTFLRYLGFETDRQIVEQFYTIENIKITDKLSEATLLNKVPFEDLYNGDALLLKAYEPISVGLVANLQSAGIKKIEVIDISEDETLIKTLKKDPSHDQESALKEIYKRLRPGDPAIASQSRALLERTFKDPKKYDLTRVGRYKLNKKLGLNVDSELCIMAAEDFTGAMKHLLAMKRGHGTADDIDHLGSRRIRAVGELLANQCRSGLARTERLVRERMASQDSQNIESLEPQKLINPKALNAVVRDFFGRSQLSQFMDQINPLAELTHKRRLSALGPGGLNRDRAGFEVRDVHSSHYGRICPIETPEGPNIGLINSLSLFARINEYGFIETPYYAVEAVEKDGKTYARIDISKDDMERRVYLTADEEERYTIAQHYDTDNEGFLIDENGQRVESVIARKRGEFETRINIKDLQYMDVSHKQILSVAAALIPFFAHDDANRALMGSNMQRQAVPLLVPEAPLVGTGLEGKVVADSRSVVRADVDGVIAAASAEVIVITPDGELPVKTERFLSDYSSVRSNPAQGIYVYPLRKFMRSNAGTCINQTPIVKRGQKVSKGQILADGPSSQQGELALGRNVLVAFMPWNGYNFEDAIVISQKVVKEDSFTSIHITEFECQARDTKLGPEEITRDIPNVGDDALKHIAHNGIIRIGAEVKPGDILVGKITPKSETELAPEERLLRAIFGEKAADVKDTSLRVPSGVTGIVMDVRISSHASGRGDSDSDLSAENKKQFKKINDEYKKKIDGLTEQLTDKLSGILLGERMPLDVVNAQNGEVIIPANKKITKMLLRKLAANHDKIEIDPSPVRNRIFEIINSFEGRYKELDDERERRLDSLESGSDVEQGTIKEVKVYIAEKRKLSVGDKMAGRHGNKGVVAKIVPESDMPFLADGTPVDIVLNPLGVPSRMNVGQILETHLGVAAKALGYKVATPVFDDITEDLIRAEMGKAKQVDGFTWIGDGADGSTFGKSTLYDGLTGDKFHQPVVVGCIYMLKLNHLVADKIHARAVGPYSLVTQQPLGGKAQYGGQRFGEMEVWALEAYGAAYTLQELLTVKSDDVQGRTRIYEAIVKGDNNLEAGTPESFNVLIKEMQALGLDIRPIVKGEEVDPTNVIFKETIDFNDEEDFSGFSADELNFDDDSLSALGGDWSGQVPSDDEDAKKEFDWDELEPDEKELGEVESEEIFDEDSEDSGLNN